ncbi:hypothetical protein L195_g045287 [Trifolium pratense]|uniref:Uncharacterized protein n=1 Tax=Trifolium pratense TaxID=57577 RepID=A0A2K3MEF3_TRIPR|nr:hypothetical protein L195_g045287 [Trifolium pratense]
MVLLFCFAVVLLWLPLGRFALPCLGSSVRRSGFRLVCFVVGVFGVALVLADMLIVVVFWWLSSGMDLSVAFGELLSCCHGGVRSGAVWWYLEQVVTSGFLSLLSVRRRSSVRRRFGDPTFVGGFEGCSLFQFVLVSTLPRCLRRIWE